MLKHSLAAVGLFAICAAAVPQAASAQAMDHRGPGEMGHRGPGDFRFRGGQGHFGAQGGRLSQDRTFGRAMNHRAVGGFRLGDGGGQIRRNDEFRFPEGHRHFGYGEQFRIQHRREGFGYGERFRAGRPFEYRRDFERREFGYGYPYGAGFGVFHPHTSVVDAGYRLPRSSCSTRRNVSLTPVGWHKIVTVQTCYVR